MSEPPTVKPTYKTYVHGIDSQIRVKALSYNISWASQKNITAGSEKDFVEICRQMNIHCFNNCKLIIEDIHDLHIIGLQEVNTDNLDEELIEKCKHLTRFCRGKFGNSTVSLIWNHEIFGDKVDERVINLKDGESRPCLFVNTTKGYQLIVAHFPWIEDQEQINIISNMISENSFEGSIPIVIADTNDAKTFISKDNPFKINQYELSQGLTKDEIKKQLVSCCWHKKGHQYQSFHDTGDYILAPNSIMVKNYIPELYEDFFASDHRPVVADLIVNKQ